MDPATATAADLTTTFNRPWPRTSISNTGPIRSATVAALCMMMNPSVPANKSDRFRACLVAAVSLIMSTNGFRSLMSVAHCRYWCGRFAQRHSKGCNRCPSTLNALNELLCPHSENDKQLWTLPMQLPTFETLFVFAEGFDSEATLVVEAASL